MQSFNEWKENNPLKQFLQNRLDGAKKITTQAAAKGGDARLTAWHFQAKLPVYEELLKFKGNIKKHCQTQYKALARRLANLTMNEKDFQSLMGRMEVYGEVYLKG
jgi:hypothetical protein